MTHDPGYVREKLVVAVGFLNGRGSLGKRVRRAWEEMSPLNSTDFGDNASRRSFASLQATKELYVIEGQVPKLSDAQLETAHRNILSIHDKVVGAAARK